MRNLCLFCLLLLLCCCADRGNVSRELDRVEALIKDNPAYALDVLDSLSQSEVDVLTVPKYQARYILLSEYAKYRNGIDEKNDSLISIAEEYYMQHGTDHERMLCLFLHGRALFSSQEYGSAMLKYAYAAEYAKTCSDHFMLGQIYTNQYLLCADVFGTNAIELAQEAQKEYSMAGDSIYIMDSKTNLGIAYYRNRQYEESECVLESALHAAYQLKDTFAIKKCVRFLAYLNNEKGEAVVADSLFQVLFNSYHERCFLKDYAILSEVHAQQCHYDSALYYLKKAADLDRNSMVENRIQYLKSSTRVYADMSDYKIALRYCIGYQSIRDSIYCKQLNNSVMKEQSDFIQDKLAQTEQKNNFQLLLICCLSLLLVVAILFLRNSRMKRCYFEKELDLRNQNIKNSIRGMKLSAIVFRFREYSERNQRPSLDDWKKLNSLYHEMLPFFEDVLRDKVGSLREVEWEMCMLQKLDFKAKEIDNLIGNSSSLLSNRLALKHLPKGSGAAEWRNFVMGI